MKPPNPLLNSNDETLLRESAMPSTIIISIKRDAPKKKKKAKETNSTTNKLFSAMRKTGLALPKAKKPKKY